MGGGGGGHYIKVISMMTDLQAVSPLRKTQTFSSAALLSKTLLLDKRNTLY